VTGVPMETSGRTEWVCVTDGVWCGGARWGHGDGGDRKPWAHVRAALTGSSVTIPLVGSGLCLGDHQAVFLAEFDGPRSRTLRITTL